MTIIPANPKDQTVAVASSVSSYLDHLPAIFHEDPFVGRFLLAFETIFSGQGDLNHVGLEETIGQLADMFDPATTREEFLPWLASWVALSLRADWDTATKRSFIQESVSLYRLRGTKAGLARMLEIYTGQPPEIDDDFGQRRTFSGEAEAGRSRPEPVAQTTGDRARDHRPGETGPHVLCAEGGRADYAAGIAGVAQE